MAATVVEVSREQLWEKMRRGDDIVVVDALSPMSYAASHLPGAINMPLESISEQAHRRIPDRDCEVVVYCASSTCESSVEVATRLVELGYRNVRRYADGKRDWIDAGLPLEGGRVQPPTRHASDS